MKVYAVIRLRGSVKVRKEILDMLKMLKLHRVNHCVLVPKTPDFEGMLKKVKDYVTYGEIKKETLVKLLKERGRVIGNKKLDEETLKKITGFKSFEEFADALLSGKVKLKDFEELKPVFRLSPPKKGLKSKKFHYPKGDLGYRGDAINELIERML
ncbi:MAG: 50S ribosomal protein L30 [Candidatus Aenigmarchaeota archaeon]|nr:50S ribosomal protein L30 [Candidatus Aenigmarchaeota archaeon]